LDSSLTDLSKPLLSGNNLYPIVNKYISPTIVAGIPTPAKVKNENPSSPKSSNRPWTTRFVDVPINVIIPPRIVAYDKGSKNFEASYQRSIHHLFRIGVNVATIGVLFRNAESTEVGKNKRIIESMWVRLF